MALAANCICLQGIRKSPLVLASFKRISSTRPAQTVILEKTLETPIIVLREEDDVDIIGPPDSVSNLRPIFRKILKDETALQRRFRETADATQKWNQDFWAVHNTNFIKEKEAYIKQNISEEKSHLNADEMSLFYKDFLNKYWRLHVDYNFEWYKKNFILLLLAFRVQVESIHSKIL